MTIISYKDLYVWRKGMEIVRETYELTSSFPQEERYGLSSQMQRAAVSIPSNIAEGYLRQNSKEYVQFLRIAISSCAELETQILVCKMVPKFQNIGFDHILNQVKEELKMLFVLTSRIKTRIKTT